VSVTTVEEHTGPGAATTEVLRRARLGHRDAWDELVRRYTPAIAAAVRGYRLQDSDVRDATQRTWLRLLEHHGSLRDPEALGHWLGTTARRECLRILREHRRVSPVEDVGQDRATEADDIEQQVLDAELLVRVRATMQGLPERSRILLEELFGEDPPRYADLAGAYGIPIGSIGPTRARALRQLRLLLESTRSAAARRAHAS
jgi:RNA polymerase sigma factor (sigma-70 family)